MNNSQACPCGTQKAFKDCCEPYILGDINAPSPEALMRSRYSAYATKNFVYVALSYAINHVPAPAVDINLPDIEVQNSAVATIKRPVTISGSDIESSSEGTLWCKLDVLSAFELEGKGEVEFVAYYKIKGQFFAMHERSRFTNIDGKWFYEDGDMLHKTRSLKLGRNDYCICGSGKKFKRCCQA
jgi:SEC-C motif-containing protein